MKRSLFIALLATAVAIGCKKNEPAVDTNAAAPQTPPAENAQAAQPDAAQPDASAAAPAPSVPVAMPATTEGTSPVPTPDNGDMARTLSDLSLRVRSFIVSNKHVPATFDEFVKGSPGLQIPPPPDGKKYSFDRKMNVILVNR
jgi:hypothetical protein